MSQQEIADHLGIAQSTYWNWENDKVRFNIHYLEQIAELLKINACDLLPEGAVVKTVQKLGILNHTSKDFEVRATEREFNEKLIRSLEKTIALLKGRI